MLNKKQRICSAQDRGSYVKGRFSSSMTACCRRPWRQPATGSQSCAGISFLWSVTQQQAYSSVPLN